LDSLPSVRQNAANNLVDFSEVVHMSIFDSKLTPRLEQFSFDQNVTLSNFYKFKLIYFYINRSMLEYWLYQQQ